MQNVLIPSGSFYFKGELFEIYLENETNFVWFSKPDDFRFGFKNYNETKAEDPLEALKIATKTVSKLVDELSLV